MLKNKTKTFLAIVLMMIIFWPKTGLANQQNKKVYFLIQGLFNLSQKMGTSDDYIPGENDFPITPAHLDYGVGCGILLTLSNRLGIQLSGNYLIGAEVKKEDPSDGETYQYKTYNNFNVISSLLFRFGRKNRFFISGGGGINILKPYKDKEVEGSLGSIIVIQAPDSKIYPLVSLGGGMAFYLKKTIIKIEAVYNIIFDYKKNSLLLRLGFGF